MTARFSAGFLCACSPDGETLNSSPNPLFHPNGQRQERVLSAIPASSANDCWTSIFIFTLFAKGRNALNY
jgi:hypothetical protein